MANNDRFRDDEQRRRWREDRTRDERGLRAGPERKRGGSFGREAGGSSDWDRMEGWSGEDRSARYGGDDWGGSRGSDREGRSFGRGGESPDFGSPTDFGRPDRDRGFSGSRDYGSGESRGYGRQGGGYGRYGEGSADWGFGGSDRGSWRGRDQGSWTGNRAYGDDNDRGFFDRAADEVASWFGDDDAERRRRRDARRDGEHRGRGPQSYRRSDDRIREDVNDRLTDDPHIDASGIDVIVENGEVTLSGTVAERFAKRHAEDLTESVSGVQHVQNNLRVRRDDSMSSSASTAPGAAGSSAYGASTGARTSTSGSASAAGTSATGTGSSSTDRSRT